jgi:hypothetical protein
VQVGRCSVVTDRWGRGCARRICIALSDYLVSVLTARDSTEPNIRIPTEERADNAADGRG